MDQIDGKVFALIAGLVFGAIECAKVLLPAAGKTWINGKEQVLSWILGLAGVCAAKALGAFHSTDWVSALLWATGSGIGAQMIHDSVWDPLTKLVRPGTTPPAPTSTAPAPAVIVTPAATSTSK